MTLLEAIDAGLRAWSLVIADAGHPGTGTFSSWLVTAFVLGVVAGGAVIVVQQRARQKRRRKNGRRGGTWV